jgi:hypothetical protein
VVENRVQEVVCLQGFRCNSFRIAVPSDFNKSVAERQLTIFYTIDAVCIGGMKNSSNAKIPEVVNLLSPHLDALF